MTWDEFMGMIDWMTLRWTEPSRWGEERLYAMYEDLRPWPVEGALRVAKNHYEDGNTRAPGGGQLIRLMKDYGYSPEVDQSEEHRHVWAIDEWETEREDGLRAATCVICSVERTFSPKVLRTPGEWEEHREANA